MFSEILGFIYEYRYYIIVGILINIIVIIFSLIIKYQKEKKSIKNETRDSI